MRKFLSRVTEFNWSYFLKYNTIFLISVMLLTITITPIWVGMVIHFFGGILNALLCLHFFVERSTVISTKLTPEMQVLIDKQKEQEND